MVIVIGMFEAPKRYMAQVRGGGGKYDIVELSHNITGVLDLQPHFADRQQSGHLFTDNPHVWAVGRFPEIS